MAYGMTSIVEIRPRSSASVCTMKSYPRRTLSHQHHQVTVPMAGYSMVTGVIESMVNLAVIEGLGMMPVTTAILLLENWLSSMLKISNVSYMQ